MLLLRVNSDGTDQACWRYAYQIPTQEVLDDLRDLMPGMFVTEVALVFFEGDHAELHKYFDARFPGVTDFGTPGHPHLAIVREPGPEGEGC
jgi:hypothetical protein